MLDIFLLFFYQFHMLSDNLRSASSLAQNAKSAQAMYIQSEDSLGQVGECPTDKRMYEAFCTVCHVY